ncbi:retrotransposon protein [Cucumis melo var. makuwa]|uniref:Retrotransposon protein n=1 Tax=Cucumis melo var. makuwa TaxID=1194695 RepID=A0A5A7SL78_CUCMM|nr:retrotransposon protein [Cucumis melo var. makuwa]
MNNNKRLPHTPPDTRYRIRELAYFRMIYESDLVCRQSMRMDRRTFAILCHLLRNVAGLSSTEIVDVEEMVAMFLHVLAHDVKNRVIQREFNCLGALDETYIKVNVLAGDRPTFRTRYYYLCDAGYPNAEGFLAPYRGQRYHLQEWRGDANAPTNAKEYFNMKHSSARNVIEHVEMTYCEDVDDEDEGDSTYATTTASEDIQYIETTNEWSQWRDDLTELMFTEWQLRNA